MMNNLQNHSQQRSSIDGIYHTTEDYSSQYYYHHSNSNDGHRRRRDDAFGEFPTQMTNIIATNTPDTTTSTPLTTNRRADNQFAQDPNRLSEMRSNRVLILGGSGKSKNHRQSSSSSSSTTSFINTPNTNKNNATPVSDPNAPRLLDYSMITTPGAVGTLGSCRHEEKTKGVVHWASGTPFSNILRGVVSSTPGSSSTDAFPTPYTAARELLNNKRSTSASLPVMDSLANTTQSNIDNNNGDDNTNMENTALTFAKSAPLSGYLRKLGKNIPTFKRRFFVLKPSTHLYYFISPNDVEPRGCIDLDIDRDEKNGKEGCVVKEIGSFPDGTFRFELTYDEEAEPTEDRGSSNVLDDNDSDAASRSSQTSSRRRNFRRQSIVLEARSEEMGREWMAKLQSERLSTARSELNSLRKTLEDMKSNNLRWESSAYEEALRADEAERQRNTAISDARSWEKKFVNLNEAIRLLVKNKSCSSSSSSSKQEGTSSCIDFLTETIEDLDVKGTNFDALSEAFHTIHNDYNELSKREDTFNRRVADLEKRANDAESRAIKAETELSKILEEYQTTQIELKKTKREKKILVKEVRSLHAASITQLEQHASSGAQSDQNQNDLQSNNSQHPNTAALTRPNDRIKEEERRLVIELEEHVMSGLRLSDQFLTLNGIDPSEILDDLDNSVQASSIHDAKSTRSPQRPPTNQNSEDILLDLSPIPGSRAGNDMFQRSLLDEKDDESADDAALVFGECKPVTPYFSNNGGDQNNDIDLDNNLRNVKDSTYCPDLQNHDFKQYSSPSSDVVHQNLHSRFIDTSRQQEATRAYQSTQSTFRRKEGSDDRALPSLDMASSASESSRSRVTDNGLATTKLECPLNDVEETTYHHRNNRTIGDDGNVYHITFYSNKIGLQFQKVPNEPQSGLLTEAMTADHGPNVGGANKTAAELRRIASISQHTQHTKGTLPMVCLPATPADAVLVCGVVGFDESCGNTPPQIGARLVAFDGIPVEVGKWTFESIRKSILARGRPMTLSFRNDFLTPKQRTILTKAVEAVTPSTTKSAVATHSSYSSTIGGLTDTGVENTIVRSTSSISSQRSSQPKSKYYSFSEAGSSISSAVAPLVSNLLSDSLNASIGKNQEDVQFAPGYMKRASDSLEEMRHHHDFQSGLL